MVHSFCPCLENLLPFVLLNLHLASSLSAATTHNTHTHTFIYKYTIYTYFFCCCFLFYSFCCSFLWLNTKAAGFCASACPACSSSKRLTWCRAGSDKEGGQRERGGTRMLGYGSAFCVPAPVVSCMNMKWSYNPHQTTK